MGANTIFQDKMLMELMKNKSKKKAKVTDDKVAQIKNDDGTSVLSSPLATIDPRLVASLLGGE